LWRKTELPQTHQALKAFYEPSGELQGFDRATDFDIRCYLPGDILVKVDRAAMAHGLETRAPFLDVDLVEFTLSLPAALRFKKGSPKHLLRQSCASLWPESVQSRSKQGFGAPISNWLKRPDVQERWQRVRSPTHALATLLPGVSNRSARSPQLVWTLLCLGLWLERRPSCLNHLSSQS
jgi:asparagine synthase (glutamine-hydrolysing)